MTYETACRHLGIPIQASEDEVKKAFRRLAVRVHPDKFGGKDADFKLACLARDICIRGKIPAKWVGIPWTLKLRKISESTFQGEVIRRAEKEGAFVFNIHGHAMQKSGMPDLYISSKMWRGFLELKVENNPMDKDQKIVMDELKVVGDNAYVLRYESDTGVTLEYEMKVFAVGTWPMNDFLQWIGNNTK